MKKVLKFISFIVVAFLLTGCNLKQSMVIKKFNDKEYREAIGPHLHLANKLNFVNVEQEAIKIEEEFIPNAKYTKYKKVKDFYINSDDNFKLPNSISTYFYSVLTRGNKIKHYSSIYHTCFYEDDVNRYSYLYPKIFAEIDKNNNIISVATYKYDKVEFSSFRETDLQYITADIFIGSKIQEKTLCLKKDFLS